MKIMRIALCAMLILFQLIQGAALASGSSFIPCDCGHDVCICFIQLGDSGGFVKGIINLLIDQRYLDTGTPRNLYSNTVKEAVERFQKDNSLPITGTMDDDTLTLLIWGMLPEELDVRMPVSRYARETYPDMVYVPTDGGKKRHSDPECSDMYDPRKVSIRNADKIGFKACKKCEVDRENLLH